MDQTNAIIDCDVSRLNFPLRPLHARQGHNFVARFRRVPADVTRLYVRLFKAGGAYYDVTAQEHADGTWTARIPAACFPSTCETEYEVHATAADDEPCAIGRGRLSVGPFSTTAAPAEPGAVQEVARIPCRGGGSVDVVMTWDGYEWVPEAVAAATANDGGKEAGE